MARSRLGIAVIALFAAFGMTAAGGAFAGGSDVISVIHERLNETHSFDVSIRHADEGWDHYADRFEIVGMDGTVLAIRELAHPHVNEQPFTRMIGGVRLPRGVRRVTVRARDSVHGLVGQAFTIDTRQAYSCGVPAGSGITPPKPVPSSGRARCPVYLPDRSTDAADPA